MKGFLQEYGVIMVVIAVVLGMLAFGKGTYAKSIQNAILGSTDHILEKGQNITNNLEVGTVIEIDGSNYIVMKKLGNGNYYMNSQKIVAKKAYQLSGRTDGRAQNTYENSTIDNYLEKEWYPSLSAEMQKAIQPTKIKQSPRAYVKGKWVPAEKIPYGETYNELTRHAFVPSIEELEYIVDFNNSEKIKAYANKDYLWVRDSHNNAPDYAININCLYGTLNQYWTESDNYIGVRPGFVLNASQVNYKKVGEVSYK